MAQDIVPRHIYYKIFASLLALTLLTVGVAFLDLGRMNAIIVAASGIPSSK